MKAYLKSDLIGVAAILAAMIIIGLIILWTGPANAATYYRYNLHNTIRGTGEGLPPKKYDHPYPGHWQKIYLPLSQVHQYCPGWSCTRRDSPWNCTTYFANDLGNLVEPVLMFRHEQGHCNGWGNPQNEHPPT